MLIAFVRPSHLPSRNISELGMPVPQIRLLLMGHVLLQPVISAAAGTQLVLVEYVSDAAADEDEDGGLGAYVDGVPSVVERSVSDDVGPSVVRQLGW